MTEGLKERDKVKSLFSKFHGSSVAEDLIGKDIGVGGQSKDVVVFFSDIRGFTAFSEKRSPEEVVEMLNEYFGVMVKIINSHGGVVDKLQDPDPARNVADNLIYMPMSENQMLKEGLRADKGTDRIAGLYTVKSIRDELFKDILNGRILKHKYLFRSMDIFNEVCSLTEKNDRIVHRSKLSRD
jgi:hypothetical protein